MIVSYALLLLIPLCHGGLDPWDDPPTSSLYKDNFPVKDVKIEEPSKSIPYQDNGKITFEEMKMFYNRLVKIIFNRNYFKNNKDRPNTLLRKMYFHVRESDVARLNAPILTHKDLQEIDGLISDIVAMSGPSYEEVATEMFITWSELFWEMYDHPTVKISLVGVSILLMLIYLKYMTLLSTTTSFMIIALSIGYLWTYYLTYMEAEIDRMLILKKSVTVPIECDNSKMSFFENMFSNKNRCKDFYMARNIPTFAHVNPIEVFVEMITVLLMKPFGTVCLYIGNGMSVLYQSTNFFLFIPSMIFTFTVIVFIVCFACGVPIHLNIFHLIQLKFGLQRSQTVHIPAPPLVVQPQLSNEYNLMHKLVDALIHLRIAEPSVAAVVGCNPLIIPSIEEVSVIEKPKLQETLSTDSSSSLIFKHNEKDLSTSDVVNKSKKSLESNTTSSDDIGSAEGNETDTICWPEEEDLEEPQKMNDCIPVEDDVAKHLLERVQSMEKNSPKMKKLLLNDIKTSSEINNGDNYDSENKENLPDQ